MPQVSWDDLFIRDQWAVYSRLLDLWESHLEQDLQSSEQWVEQQAKQIEDEYTRSQFYEFHSEEYHEQMEFRVILMNSLFVSSFASFENQLMRICRVAKRNSGSPSSVEDLRSHPSIKRPRHISKGLASSFPPVPKSGKTSPRTKKSGTRSCTKELVLQVLRNMLLNSLERRTSRIAGVSN